MNDTAAVLANEPALVAQSTVNPAAFAAIYDHYFPRVYNYMRYRLPDADTADDVTAQIFEIASFRRSQKSNPRLFVVAPRLTVEWTRPTAGLTRFLKFISKKIP
jgi:hypothetical protein